MCNKNEINGVIQKPLRLPSSLSSFRRDITLALLVKFLLLGALWWVFFAGHKQPVTEAIIASKILGEQRSSSPIQTTPEIHS
jgi:hypothetical protein